MNIYVVCGACVGGLLGALIGFIVQVPLVGLVLLFYVYIQPDPSGLKLAVLKCVLLAGAFVDYAPYVGALVGAVIGAWLVSIGRRLLKL